MCLLDLNQLAYERLKAKQDRANAKRRKPRRDQKYRGPNQLVEDAAHMIVLEESEMDSTRILEDFALRIASGRLRFTSNPSRAVMPKEVDVERSRIMEAVNKLAKDESKKPWSYLRVKPSAEKSWERFNAALEKARVTGLKTPKCQNNPARYSDYDDDDMPTAVEAEMACAGCPLLLLCAEYANAEKPAWGVWAGKRWAYGEVVND